MNPENPESLQCEDKVINVNPPIIIRIPDTDRNVSALTSGN
jgi:hypothetical protein